MKLATREIVRRIDNITIQEYGVPGIVLMENAGKAVVSVISSEFPKAKKFSIICGAGNNAGDGFVIARHLLCKNLYPKTYLINKFDDYNGDAKTNLEILKSFGAEIVELDGDLKKIKKSELIIDAIFGTGLDRNLKGFYKDIIEFINSNETPCISVDMPSGIDSDTGNILGAAIKAYVTVTFVVPKIGITIHPGLEFAGKVYVSNISTPEFLEKDISYNLTTFNTCKNIIKPRSLNTHKGTYGHLLIVAGSEGKSGAASLSTNAAVRTGSGLVTLAIPKSLNKVMEQKTTEAMTEPVEENKKGNFGECSYDKVYDLMSSNKSALAIGPGISTSKDTRNFLFDIFKNTKLPIVADADAITLISEDAEILKQLKAPIILTPHPGEMGRLVRKSSKEIQLNRIEIAKEFATNNNCYLILKGARSIIASPSGEIYINPTGNPGMATGGMGDVLTGVVASLLSQGYSPIDSCILGTFIHGYSGDLVALKIGDIGITATDVIDNIPEALNNINTDPKQFIHSI